jgi:hypothetical protein
MGTSSINEGFSIATLLAFNLSISVHPQQFRVGKLWGLTTGEL